MNWRNFRIGARLGIGFGLILGCLILLLAAATLLAARNRSHLIEGLNAASQKQVLANEMKSAMLEAGIAMRNIGIQLDVAEMQREDARVKFQRKRFEEARDRLTKLGLSAEEQAVLSRIASIDQQIEDPFKEAVGQALAFNAVDALKIIATVIDPLNNKSLQELNKLVELQEQSSRQTFARSIEAGEEMTIWLYIFIFAAALVSVFLTMLLTRSITQPLQTAVDIAQTVATGDLDVRLEVKGRDETALLLRSLMDMNAALRKARSAASERDWFKTGQNELNNIMRGEQDVASMASKVLSYLVNLLQAQIGSFYLYDEHAHKLRLTAGCGITPQPKPEAKSEPNSASNSTSNSESGEVPADSGLLGRALSERKTLLVNDAPSNYLAVASSLGSADPACIAVVPLLHGENMVGAMELAAFRRFTEVEQEFLESAREAIAIGFEVTQSRLRTQALLYETEQQAEELRVQQEELQQTNEELEERAELLEMQRAQISAKTSEIERASHEIRRKAEELEKVSAYKSEFLANMSHELRTPLNSMLILSGLLKENKGGNLSSKQMEHAATINAAGQDLLNLINDILDLSKVEAGQVDFHFEDYAPGDLCQSMHRLFHAAAEQKGLDFFIVVVPGMPEHIRVDMQRTQQVLKNLIGNAIKFTHQGSVTLRVFLPDAADNPLRSPAIGCAVIDTGIGISQDKQGLVFEAFKQADGGISRKYGGTGLGLSISLELARKMGGELVMQSEEGRGSTFTLYLPLEPEPEPALVAQSKAPAAAAAPRQEPAPIQSAGRSQPAPVVASTPADAMTDPPAPDASRRAILIVEDDAAFAGILTEFVEQHGFYPVVAGDGEAGIMRARQLQPCAVLLDVMLPKIDGWGVMRSLKEHPDTRHIPVHFITCLEDRQRAMEMGAVGFITKPVKPDQLREVFATIEEAIDKEVKKLLIVEDDEAEAEGLVHLLSDSGIVISVASTGGEAIAFLEEDRYDCMVLDLGLADMSGFELLAHIQDMDRARQLPVIVHSGKELTREQERELHRYAQSIIIKGAKSPERLLNEVTLFLHMVENRLDPAKRAMIRTSINRQEDLEGRKMLVVDDDMRNVYSLTNLLEEKGVDVVVAENGKEALSELEHQPDICLVLMDIMMPEMDGYEAMRTIRKNAAWMELPIIAMTAKVMKGDHEKCLEAGASDYIGKPIDGTKLMSMLRVWTRR
jgi:CheY-like chemotaxis protein